MEKLAMLSYNPLILTLTFGHICHLFSIVEFVVQEKKKKGKWWISQPFYCQTINYQTIYIIDMKWNINDTSGNNDWNLIKIPSLWSSWLSSHDLLLECSYLWAAFILNLTINTKELRNLDRVKILLAWKARKYFSIPITWRKYLKF